MAKKKIPEMIPKAQADERRAQVSNAESQKRYRENMKAQGYRALLVWDKPPEKGKVKAWPAGAAPLIHERTAGIYERDEKIKAAVESMFSAFFFSMHGDKENMSREAWAIYRDIEMLLSPLGYKNPHRSE